MHPEQSPGVIPRGESGAVIVSFTAFCCLLYLALALSLGTAAASSPLGSYVHTAWNGQRGAPSDVMQFTQTPDGWLWISSPNGLYRFDGVNFTRMSRVQGHPVHTQSTLGLLTTRDGRLWVGGRLGGISVFGEGNVRRFTEADGLPKGGVLTMTEGPDGSVWAATGTGLGYLAPGAKSFRRVGNEEGLPEARTDQVLYDRNGRQWVAVEGGVHFRDPGDKRYRRAWPRINLMAMAEAPDGTLWGSDGVNKHYRILAAAPKGNPRPRAELEGNGALFDRAGNMWILKVNALERREAPYVGRRADVRQFTKENGMSGPLPQTVFEDREGNLWIGTAAGVDRLRRSRLQSVPVATAFDRPAVVADERGGVIIGDWRHPLRHYTIAGPRETLGQLDVSSVYRAADGGIWLASSEERWHRSAAGKLQRWPHPRQLAGISVQSMTIDGAGSMWLSTGRHGLFTIKGEAWHKSLNLPDTLALSLATDGTGRVWAGYVDNQVALIDGTHIRIFGESDGLRLGNVQSLLVDGTRIWAGGQDGLAWYDGKRWHHVATAERQPFRGVSGLARLGNGELWVYGSDGISRVSADAVERLLRQPDWAIPYERFDALDGLVGSAEQFRPLPSMAQSSDGRLWFATASEVASLDPASIARNPLAPPVQILSLRSGEGTYAVHQGLTLPTGQRDLRIAYTALGLTIPERVRFRYKLEGFDEHWQDAGTRREAVYTNLPPGNYRFRVLAANEDGVWSEAEAGLRLILPPRFVETVWFLGLVLLSAGAFLAGAYVLRVRQLSARLQYRLEERLAERERIARGLHDTLLQSVQGLILFFHQQTRSLSIGADERAEIERTLDLADELLAEGRDCISGLRGTRELEEWGAALARYGHALMPGRFAASILGQPVPLRPQLGDEVQLILREAMFNAARHAQASKVELTITYRSDRLLMVVRDNGCGMAPVFADEGPAGHFGIVGMRERAKAIGASYKLLSASGQGTTVRLEIPAKRAYLKRSFSLPERLRPRRKSLAETA